MNGKLEDALKNGFSFDWIIKPSNPDIKADLLNFYQEGQWEVAFVERREKTKDGLFIHYWAGNPLLGGIKDFKKYDSAEKYFFEMLGRIHMDAECRKAKEQVQG